MSRDVPSLYHQSAARVSLLHSTNFEDIGIPSSTPPLYLTNPIYPGMMHQTCRYMLAILYNILSPCCLITSHHGQCDNKGQTERGKPCPCYICIGQYLAHQRQDLLSPLNYVRV